MAMLSDTEVDLGHGRGTQEPVRVDEQGAFDPVTLDKWQPLEKIASGSNLTSERLADRCQR